MKQLSQSKLLYTRARVWSLALAVMAASTLAWAEAPRSKSKPVKYSSTPDLNSSKSTDRLEALEADKKNRKFSGQILKEKLKTETDPRVRHRLNQALSASDAPDKAVVLMNSLKIDTDPSVRQGAAQLLGNYVQNSAVVLALDEALNKDASAPVRYAAALSLGLSNSPRATAALAKSVNDSDPNLRRQIAFSLKRQNSKASQALVKRLLSDSDLSVRKMAKDGQP